jgi:hypothetical protein
MALATTATYTSFAQNYRSAGHIGLCYPISTHGISAKDYSNIFSLHAILGISASEKAFCASGFANIIQEDASGFIVAGFSNHVGGNTRGFIAGGFMNTINDNTRGVQLAGFTNISLGNVRGLQGAGFMNISRNADGLQIAGFFNKAGDVNTQMAGFINIARTAKVQLSGFMNIADSCDYPIGIINIIKKGEKSLGLSIDGNGTSMATFRSGGRVLYGIVGLGFNRIKINDGLAVAEVGLGAHLTLSKLIRFNIEASTASFTDLTDEVLLSSGLRLLPSLTIGEHLELFAGPVINSVNSEGIQGKEFSSHYLWSNYSSGYFNGVYLNVYGGISYRL